MVSPEGRELKPIGDKFVRCDKPCFTGEEERDWTLLSTVAAHGLTDANGEPITRPVPKCLHPGPGAPRVCVDALGSHGIEILPPTETES